MASIDFNVAPLLKADGGQTANTAAGKAAKGTFKQILNSVLKVPESLDEIFSEASKKYGVSEKLLKAVAKAESNFKPSATSKKGAAGIMQLMPATARALGVADPYDARSNIMGGAKYLKEKLNQYNGNVELTLAAYNAGSGNVSKYGGIPPFKETEEYVKKIMGYMGEDRISTKGSAYYAVNSASEPASGSGFSLSDYNAYFSRMNYGSSDLGKVLESLASSPSADKSDYLYLVELMKMRMQAASGSISGLDDNVLG